VTEAAAAIRVMVADDHAIVRIGLVSLIESEAGLAVVAEAEDGRQALDLFRAQRPDVTIMDIRMPGMDGVSAARSILEIEPAAAIIILTSFEGDEDVFRALEAGARGYLLKRDALGDDMLQAIRVVHGGQRFIPAEVARVLADRVGLAKLSGREVEVLRLVARGMSNREIAEQLTITEGTAKIHIGHILAKLGAGDRTEAVTLALRRGIISLES
jgi:two-component system, NarL family, response regulator